jgi:hypothetical protein
MGPLQGGTGPLFNRVASGVFRREFADGHEIKGILNDRGYTPWIDT